MNLFEEIVSLNLPAVIVSLNLPAVIVMNIEKRITDWLASGGKEDDPYIMQQLRYARNVSAARNNK